MPEIRTKGQVPKFDKMQIKGTEYPFAILDAEAFCLISSGSVRSEKRGHTCQTLQRAVRNNMVAYEEYRVRGISGSSLHKMVMVVVRSNGKDTLVMADIITGSLYNLKTGKCYTGNLRMGRK